jgi:transcriptional regulator with XRE-family HTH domain
MESHLEKRRLVILLQKGMTQREIAEKMGVHQPKVSEWLNGLRMPNTKSLYKLAEVLEEEPVRLVETLKQISEL